MHVQRVRFEKGDKVAQRAAVVRVVIAAAKLAECVAHVAIVVELDGGLARQRQIELKCAEAADGNRQRQAAGKQEYETRARQVHVAPLVARRKRRIELGQRKERAQTAANANPERKHDKRTMISMTNAASNPRAFEMKTGNVLATIEETSLSTYP
jgi:hypothetical protein